MFASTVTATRLLLSPVTRANNNQCNNKKSPPCPKTTAGKESPNHFSNQLELDFALQQHAAFVYAVLVVALFAGEV